MRLDGHGEAERAALPGRLVIQIRPPCSSTMRLDSVSPSPVPSLRASRPPRWKASKIRSWSAASMPIPVSRTITCASPPAISARTSTDPPSGVNLTALLSRFSTTCLSLSSSAQITPTSGATASEIVIPCRAARSRTIASAYSSSSGSDSALGSSSIRPASTFERSRISLISSSRWRPESRMSRTYSSWRSLSSPNIRSSSTSEKPITAFSGVRSSCDIEARNSDLWRPATSSSRKSWTFWIAIAPWAAKVRDQLERAIAELVDLLAPQRDDADHLVARQHRHPEHRPEAAELARLVHLVVGVGEHVEDLDGAPLEPDAADQRPGAAGDRHAGEVVAVRLRPADRQRQPVDVVVEHVDLAGVGRAAAGRPGCRTVSNTGSSSNVERPMTSSTWSAADWRSRASASARSSCSIRSSRHQGKDERASDVREANSQAEFGPYSNSRR